MTRNQHTLDGNWINIGSKHYRHVGGIEIRYNHNAWMWEVVDGINDGKMFKTLTVAKQYCGAGCR